VPEDTSPIVAVVVVVGTQEGQCFAPAAGTLPAIAMCRYYVLLNAPNANY